MSANASSSSDDDDDFQFESSHVGSKRYPVHDCCDNEDADSLRVSGDDRCGPLGQDFGKIHIFQVASCDGKDVIMSTDFGFFGTEFCV